MRHHIPHLMLLLGLAGLVPKSFSAQEMQPSPVVIETIAEADIIPTTIVLGATEPRRRSIVAASIEGHVIDYSAKEGRRVKEGDVLARLRDRILHLQLVAAEAALAETREQHRNAVLDLERARELIEKDATTKKALEAAITAERTLALQIPQVEANIDILKENIAKKTVIAPFAGQIVREHTELGEWVPQGGSVATIVDLATVFVRANVPERFIRFVKEETVVSVLVPAARPQPYSGTIISVADEGDASARTFPVRVEINNDGTLRAGMTSRIEFPTNRSRRALVVSKDAIMLQGVRSYVFVVDDKSLATMRFVQTGVSSGSSFEVLDGLQPGEHVVTKGNERLAPGAPVRVLPPEKRKGSEG